MDTRAVIMRPDGTKSVKTVSGLEDLQRLVSGPVEAQIVEHGGERIAIYCHAEGKPRGLPFNRPASEFAWSAHTLPLHDQYVGPVVITGVSPDGTRRDAPAALIESIEQDPDSQWATGDVVRSQDKTRVAIYQPDPKHYSRPWVGSNCERYSTRHIRTWVRMVEQA